MKKEKAKSIASLIPCYGYAAEHRGEDIAELFVQGGSKNGFSGIALYIVPETGVVFQVSTYINGRRTASANCYSDAATKARLTKAAKRLKFYEVVPTRAGGEDIFGNPMLGDWFDGSYWLPEITVTPGGNSSADHGEGEWIGNGTTDPIDPPGTNHDDLDDNCSHCHDGEQCVGSGGAYASGDGNQQGGKYKTIKLKYDVSLYPGYETNKCKNIADKITRQILGDADAYVGDINNRKTLFLEDDAHKTLELKGDPEEIIDIIAKHLEAGCPIVAGVNHTFGKEINDSTVDHFIVINGMGKDENGKLYFNYIETGRKKPNANAACADSLRLYYYPTGDTTANKLPGMISGGSYVPGRDYDLTQIRPYLK